jgi:hypothetical protein
MGIAVASLMDYSLYFPGHPYLEIRYLSGEKVEDIPDWLLSSYLQIRRLNEEQQQPNLSSAIDASRQSVLDMLVKDASSRWKRSFNAIRVQIRHCGNNARHNLQDFPERWSNDSSDDSASDSDEIEQGTYSNVALC